MAKKDRIHSILAPSLGPDSDELLLESMRYADSLGRPFECVIRALSTDQSIDEDKLLGESLVVRYEPQKGNKRFFHGVVSEIAYHGSEGEYGVYEVVLRPWFWFLRHTTNCRIFQDVTVRDIVESVLKQMHGFTDFRFTLTRDYRRRSYCVQYCESDFDFISRLLEEEGIYYYFEHEEGRHMMVLVDEAASHKKIDGATPVPFRHPGDAPATLKHIQSWNIRSRLRSTAVTIGDYDFEKSSTQLTAKSSIHRKHKLSKFERYDYPGRYSELQDGSKLAAIRAQEHQAEHHRYLGIGNEITLATGRHFSLKDHPRKDQNGVDFLVVESIVRIESSEIHIFSGRNSKFEVQIGAIKKLEQFRSACTTARPSIVGPQSAVVVGKAGEEIWTDKHGRVKVQFLWDRQGKKDENSSCWIRVSTAWAGDGWGCIHTPRIGQEVLVEFIDGDPDRPVITGRVYNDQHAPPYKLPDNQTQSGLKTRSTKQGNSKNFNELRFEDKLGEEEIYLHAERNFTQVIENDSKIEIGKQGKNQGDQTIEVYNNRKLTVLQGNEEITINRGNRTIKTPNGQHSTQAGSLIELKVGSSSIKITPSKITISSPQIEINANGKTIVKGAMTDVSGAGLLKLGGALVKIN